VPSRAILTALSDVVEQGQVDRLGPPRWLRGGTLAVVFAVGIAVLTRSHLFSADDPNHPKPVPSVAPTGHTGPNEPILPVSAHGNTSEGISVVVRRADQLRRYVAGSGVQPLATLPDGLTHAAPLVYVQGSNGSGTLVGVDGDVLFRASPVRGHTVTPIGRAQQVVGVSSNPGRVFVLQGGAAHHRSRVVEVDARTGHLTDARPFPGYDATGPWRPAGVVSAQPGTALVLTRSSLSGRRDLALAWDDDSVRSRGTAAFVRVGSATRLLGVSDDQMLTVEDRPDTCLDHGCPITVMTVTGYDVVSRVMQPPAGWTFRGIAVGAPRGDPLVLVERIAAPSPLALAWLSRDRRAGFLIAGTEGLAGSVVPVGGSDGSVLFAMPHPEGLRLSVWLPGSPSAALLRDQPALEPGSDLVCGCR
jgi:hypothetical protein